MASLGVASQTPMASLSPQYQSVVGLSPGRTTLSRGSSNHGPPTLHSACESHVIKQSEPEKLCGCYTQPLDFGGTLVPSGCCNIDCEFPPCVDFNEHFQRLTDIESNIQDLTKQLISGRMILEEAITNYSNAVQRLTTELESAPNSFEDIKSSLMFCNIPILISRNTLTYINRIAKTVVKLEKRAIAIVKSIGPEQEPRLYRRDISILIDLITVLSTRSRTISRKSRRMYVDLKKQMALIDLLLEDSNRFVVLD